MKTVNNDRAFCSEGCVIALGTFDGVHCAHRVILERAVHLAREEGLPAIVYTFSNHPMELIHPGETPNLLTTNEEKAEQMEKLGIDILCMQPFDTVTMNQDPEVFAGELVRRFHPKHIVCGYNYSFGKNGSGKPLLLQMLGSVLQFGCSVVPQIKLDALDISSTKIRKTISAGEDRTAARLLGRNYSFDILPEGEEYRMAQAEKQMPAKGKHRVLIDDGDTQKPYILNVKDNGKMALFGKNHHLDKVRCILLGKI